MAGISFRDAKVAYFDTRATNRTVAKPDGLTAGDYVVVMLFINDTDWSLWHSPPGNFVQLDRTKVSSFSTIALFGLVAGSSEPTWNFHWGTSAYSSYLVLAWSGVDPNDPMDSLKKTYTDFRGSNSAISVSVTPSLSTQTLVAMTGWISFTASSISWTCGSATERGDSYDSNINGDLWTMAAAEKTSLTPGSSTSIALDPSNAIHPGGYYTFLLNPDATDWALGGQTIEAASSTEGHLKTDHVLSGTTVTASSDLEAAHIDYILARSDQFAEYEFLIDWNRDNGLRISDFETDFDDWMPTDRLELSTAFSYAGKSSLKASWHNQTPSANPPNTFVFNDATYGFDTGVFAYTSTDPADDEILSITYDFQGLTVGANYTLSMAVYVPAVNGQHVTVGIRDVAVSDPTTDEDQWNLIEVPFTATATEHTIFLDADGTVTDDNVTYIDYVFIVGEFEDVTTQVRADSVTWSYGRDQSRALNPISPAETEITLDNQDGRYAPNNPNSPLRTPEDFLLPNRELLIRAKYNRKSYDLFRGYTDDITIDPYITEQTAQFTAIDPLGSVGGTQLSTEVWRGLRTGDAVHKVLDEIGWPENRRDIDAGASVISHFWVEGQDASEAITDLVASEGPPAYATVSDAGYFIFRDRHHRLTRPRSSTSQVTFNASGIEPCFSPPAEINIGWKDIINSVSLTVNQRVTSDYEQPEGGLGGAQPPVVWSIPDTISIPGGESRDFKVSAETPVLDFHLPDLKKFDYTVVGGDVQFTLSRTSGSSCVLTAFAPSNDIAITGLAVRGYPVNTADGIYVQVDDEQSQADVGQKADPTSVEAPWANANDALAIGQIITRTRSRRLSTMSITVNNGTPERLDQILTRRLSDLVHIVEPRSFTDHDFYIESIDHEISLAGKLHTVKFGCEAVPTQVDADETGLAFTFNDPYAGFDTGVFAYDTIQTDPDDVFILDVSNLDEDGLGF